MQDAGEGAVFDDRYPQVLGVAGLLAIAVIVWFEAVEEEHRARGAGIGAVAVPINAAACQRQQQFLVRMRMADGAPASRHRSRLHGHQRADQAPAFS